MPYFAAAGYDCCESPCWKLLVYATSCYCSSASLSCCPGGVAPFTSAACCTHSLNHHLPCCCRRGQPARPGAQRSQDASWRAAQGGAEGEGVLASPAVGRVRPPQPLLCMLCTCCATLSHACPTCPHALYLPASPTSPHLQVSGDLDSLTDDLAHVVAGLPRPPVLVAHSFGALLAEKYMTGGWNS